MAYSDSFETRADRIAALFATSFAAAEGDAEGAAIGALARGLMETTPRDEIRVVTAEEGGRLLGAVVFTRLTYPDDPRHVMLLSPMAVTPDRQGEGVGRGLIDHGLAALRGEGVAVAVTYGDPAFYGKTGFAPVTTAVMPSPLPLSQPEGWLAQALDGAPIAPRPGPPRCVPALNDPRFW
jgi:predicted N-acetyltransferase YhbS